MKKGESGTETRSLSLPAFAQWRNCGCEAMPCTRTCANFNFHHYLIELCSQVWWGSTYGRSCEYISFRYCPGCEVTSNRLYSTISSNNPQQVTIDTFAHIDDSIWIYTVEDCSQILSHVSADRFRVLIEAGPGKRSTMYEPGTTAPYFQPREISGASYAGRVFWWGI